jgi:hypothetical protein
MNFQDAIQIMQEVQANNRLPGLLETLEFCYVPDNRLELTGQELLAYRVVVNEMSKLFAPA